MAKYYSNNRYIKKWCEKVTGDEYVEYQQNNDYLYLIAEELVGNVNKSARDNHYLKLICENLTGNQYNTYHKDKYYLKYIAKEIASNVKNNGTENYYLRLICENWNESEKETIEFPLIENIQCLNDLSPVIIDIEIGNRYNGTNVDLHINNNILSTSVENGAIRIDLNKNEIEEINECYFKVNDANYKGTSNVFDVIVGVVINTTKEEIMV